MVVLTSFSVPTEGIKHEEPSTILHMNGREVGRGTLYIAESKLSWRNSATGEGFSLMYPHIAVHGVSRDIEAHGSECLYIMLDTGLENLPMNEDDEGNEEDEGGNEEDSGGMTEMRFMPDDKGQLDAMYIAMTYCQSQHPDPEQEEPSDEEEYVDADEEGEYLLAGGDSGYIDRHNGANGWRNQDEDMDADGQFEDAEERDDFD